MAGGYVTVPISLHMGDDHVRHVLREARIRVLLVSPGVHERFARLADGITFDEGRGGGGGGVTVLPLLHSSPYAFLRELTSFEEVESADASDDDDESSLSSSHLTPDSPYLILYTSGSTGAPKGAIVSHQGFLDELRGLVNLDNDSEFSGVSILNAPLAVSATVWNIAAFLLRGGRVAIYEHMPRVFEVARSVGPSNVSLVPQMWAVFYKEYTRTIAERDAAHAAAHPDAAEAKHHACKLIAGVCDGEFFCDSCGLQLVAGDTTFGCRACDYDLCPRCHQGRSPAVKEKLDAEFRHRLGIRARALNSGGATPMPEVQRWLAALFTQCVITENYASTEAGPITNSLGEERGRIDPGVEVKLVDWGDYTTADEPFPRGEILVKSRAGARGYLNRPDLTADAWDEDGFFHTGDIGELRDATHVRVIDRCKDVFKLANGEWVSPANVEAAFVGACPRISQIFVHGTSRHEAVVAVVVPSSDGGASPSSALSVERILRQMAAVPGLRHFEIPRCIHLVDVGNRFHESNGMLTASGKICRRVIRQHFARELERLFLTSTAKRAAEAEGEIDAVVQRVASSLLLLGDDDGGHALQREEVEHSQWDGPDWSSIQVMMIKSALERKFDLGAKLALDALVRARESPLAVARLVRDTLSGTIGSGVDLARSVPTFDLAAECELDADINAAHSPPSSASGSARRDVIMLTGATGFLGAALLQSLCERFAVALADSRVEIWCVAVRVRGSGDPTTLAAAERAAQARLIESLRKRAALTEAVYGHIRGGRVRALAGDLCEPRLGLSESLLDERFGTATEGGGGDARLAVVVHCASWVNHALDYGNMRASNVGSATDLARLAARSGARPELVYISTISVLSDDEGDECSVGDPGRLTGGYSQSKYVAEMRLREACARGVFSRGCVVRPGLLGPHSATGSANESDWLIRFLAGGLQIGGLRVRDGPATTVNITAVDAAARYIVEGMLVYSSGGGTPIDGDEPCCNTFHLPLTIAMPTAAFVEAFLRACRGDGGRRMRVYERNEWRDALEHLPETNPLHPFRRQFAQGFSGVGAHAHAVTDRSLEARMGRGFVARPAAISEGAMAALVGFLRSGSAAGVIRPRMLRRTLSDEGASYG